MLSGSSAMDWRGVTFTEHMVEAAALEASCQVVFSFGSHEHATYEIKVFRVIKGSGAPYFATEKPQRWFASSTQMGRPLRWPWPA